MEENLQKILEKIIIPAFDRVDSVAVSRMGLDEFFLVKYYIVPPLDSKIAYDIMDETTQLFKMLGGGKNSDIMIDFVKVK